MIVAGDSAGGNIAFAVAMMLQDRKQFSPKGALLIYPVLDRGMNTESMKRYTDTPIWDANCTKGACHGFDAAIKSTIVTNSINKRINWIQSVFDEIMIHTSSNMQGKVWKKLKKGNQY